MKAPILASALLWLTAPAALCQVDTSSYLRPSQQPTMLDTLGQIQRLELQRQQIELQRLQIEQQKILMQRSDPKLQRQLEFERREAELYQRRQIERAKAKNQKLPKNSN